jgi:hypothetical protein
MTMSGVKAEKRKVQEALDERVQADARADAEALHGIPFDPQTVWRALAVMVLSPNIRAYLEEHDPQALIQARKAMGLVKE